MGWIYLLLAGLLEIAFTTAIRFTEGFTRVGMSALVLLLAATSIYFISKATLTIPLGTAYAIWGAFGAVATLVVGILYFNEPVTFWRMFFLSVIIGSCAGLKLVE
jgi:quaternary ammonium compound-resistance protein SugE